MKRLLTVMATAAIAAGTPFVSPSTAAAAPNVAVVHEQPLIVRDVDIEPNGDLRIEFGTTGSRRRPHVDIRATGTAKAIFRCENPGGELVGGRRNRTIVRKFVAETETFQATPYGELTEEEIVLRAPKAHSSYCQGPHTPVLVRVVWDDVRIRNLDTGTIVRLGRFSKRLYEEYYEDYGWDETDVP